MILTVIVGSRVNWWRSQVLDGYADLPSAFARLVADTDRWLQQRPRLPVISDPSGARARFDHRLSQQEYENFRHRFHDYAEKSSVAFDAADRDESIRLWREIFGDAFTPAHPVAVVAILTCGWTADLQGRRPGCRPPRQAASLTVASQRSRQARWTAARHSSSGRLLAAEILTGAALGMEPHVPDIGGFGLEELGVVARLEAGLLGGHPLDRAEQALRSWRRRVDLQVVQPCDVVNHAQGLLVQVPRVLGYVRQLR